MVFTYYHVVGLVPPNNPLEFSQVVEIIRTDLASKKSPLIVTIATDTLTVPVGTWTLRVRWENGPHVLAESKEIAELFAKERPDANVIATCNRRIVTAGDDDPAMTYFNEYAFVLEALQSIDGIFLFEPNDSTFI